MVALSAHRPGSCVLPTRRDERGPLFAAAGIALLLHLLFLALPIARSNVIPVVSDDPPPRFLDRTPIQPPPLPDEPIVVPPSDERRKPIPLPDREPETFEPLTEPLPPPPDFPAETVMLLPESTEPLPVEPDRVFSEEREGLIAPVALPERIAPVYPESARRVGLEGRVVLRAVIDDDGTVRSVEVVRAPRPDLGFSHAAILAVSAWRYEPGRFRGRAVAVSMTVVVDFTLR